MDALTAITAIKQALEALEALGEQEITRDLRAAIEVQEKQNFRANKLEAENVLLLERLYRTSIGLPQFATVYCSQCGGEFGPANSGYSACREHQKPG